MNNMLELPCDLFEKFQFFGVWVSYISEFEHGRNINYKLYGRKLSVNVYLICINPTYTLIILLCLSDIEMFYNTVFCNHLTYSIEE